MVEMQLGWEHHGPGSNPAPTWANLCSNARKWLIGIRAWLMIIEFKPFLVLLQDPGPEQPFSRIRTQIGSGWGRIRSRPMMLSAQLHLHHTTVAEQHLFHYPDISSLQDLAAIQHGWCQLWLQHFYRRQFSEAVVIVCYRHLLWRHRHLLLSSSRWPTSEVFSVSVLQTASVPRGTFSRPLRHILIPFSSFFRAGFFKWCRNSWKLLPTNHSLLHTWYDVVTFFHPKFIWKLENLCTFLWFYWAALVFDNASEQPEFPYKFCSVQQVMGRSNLGNGLMDSSM